MKTRSQWLVAGALLLSLVGIATAQILQRPLNPGTRKSAGISYWTAASEPAVAADGELAVRSNGQGSASELVLFDSSIAGGSGSWRVVSMASASGGTNNTIPVWDATGVLEDSVLDDVSGQMIITGAASQLSLPSGDVSNPVLVFTDSDDGTGTGFYSSLDGRINITLGGIERTEWTGNQIRQVAATAGSPAFAFTTDTNTGMFSIGADNVGFTVGGALVLDLENTNAASASATLATVSSTLGIFNGSDTATAFSVEITNVDHTGTSNTVNLINIAAISGDEESNLNAILIGALTGTSGSDTPPEEEIAINIGTGWDQAIVIGDGAAIRWEGATADTEEFRLTVSDPTADVTVIHRAGLDLADSYHVLVVPDGELVTADYTNSDQIPVVDAVAALAAGDNVMIVHRFYLPHPQTVISVDVLSIPIANVSGSDNTIAVAIYNDADAGTNIVEVVGATDDGAGGSTQLESLNITDTTLEAGWYRIGFCAQDVSDHDIEGFQVNADILLLYGGGTGEIVGTAGNACSSGNPPDTTGAISNAADAVPFILVSN